MNSYQQALKTHRTDLVIGFELFPDLQEAFPEYDQETLQQFENDLKKLSGRE